MKLLIKSSLALSQFFLDFAHWMIVRMAEDLPPSSGNRIEIEFVGGPRDGTKFMIAGDEPPDLLEFEVVTETYCDEYAEVSNTQRETMYYSYTGTWRNDIYLYSYRETIDLEYRAELDVP